MNIIKEVQKFKKTDRFTACIFQDREYSNLEITSQANRFSQGLKQIGQIPGDIVACILPNCVEIMPVYEGILRRGAVLLPIIFALTTEEIGYILKDSEAKYIVTNSELIEKVTEAFEIYSLEAKVILVDAKSSAGYFSYKEFLLEEKDIDEIVDRDSQDVAMIMYTSGTTGKPKGAMLTHGNFSAYVNYTFYDTFIRGQAALITVPMNHMYGFEVMLLMYWKRGGTIVLHEWFDPVKAIKDIEKYQIDFVPLVPTMVLMILELDDLSFYHPKKDRIWVVGGAPFPVDKIQETEDRLGGMLIQGYGLTESAGEGTCQRPENRKPGSAGKPFPGLEIKIVDEEDREVPAGEWGEICIKGWCVMKGYFNRPKETAEVLKDGWFHTGDIGYLDQEGDLFVTDRKKDMVLRGGENIYSAEVEQALYKHAAVAEAAVIGLPDPKYGEEVFAVVVLHPGQKATEEEILTEAKNLIPRYKCPKKIKFWSELPKTRTGKVFKPAVRERFLEKDTHDK
ncbi:MAG: AMP-binding protein [Deltaproteobacteria bacterium]|nr:AMP-binding protein [Deltaproteobacteria bacterium]